MSSAGVLAGLLMALAIWTGCRAGSEGQLARLHALPPLISPSRRQRARSVRVPVPVILDLVASVLAAGSPPALALRLVGEALIERGDELGGVLIRAAEQAGLPGLPPAVGLEHPQLEPLLAALELARSTGLGPVGLVRAAAEQDRHRRSRAQAVAARRLGVLVVLPTGLCLLPAFVLLTVAPLVLDLLLHA